MKPNYLGYSGAIIATFSISLLVHGCKTDQADESLQTDAPFLGPAEKLRPPAPVPAQTHIPAPITGPFQEAPPVLSIEPPFPFQPDASSNADRRRKVWLTEKFRCRAISSVKLRGCGFEEHSGGHRLKFQVSDVVCEDVEFDDNGDPSMLIDCRSSWLRVPGNNKLKRGKRQDIWSGSHSGWKWKDGEKYCCPGMWIEAPASLAGSGDTV